MNNDDPLKKHLFITFEGGEGSGKTTLVRKLAENLTKKGLQVVVTREPGGSELGERIRKWLLENKTEISIGAQAELLLFLAARAQHIDETILPALNQGKVVLCDRFNDSSIAYQGVGRNLGFEYVQTLCSMACRNLEPILTFFLDVDPVVGMERRQKDAPSGKVDRIESELIDFHKRVREGFLRLSSENQDRIHLLDANLPAESVFEQALSRIQKIFK
jgi:dTMP kinase